MLLPHYFHHRKDRFYSCITRICKQSLYCFQSEYPEKLEWAEQECRTICLPDLRNTKDVALDEDFFSKHILQEDESGYFSSSDGSVTAEEKDSELRLLTCPGYLPSYHRGLYTSNILFSVYQENEVGRFINGHDRWIELVCASLPRES